MLKGVLISGSGEGSYYMKKAEYKKEFQKKLGYIPWPGTLNIKLSSPANLSDARPIVIKGFEKRGKRFGDAKCYGCIMLGRKDLKTHLIAPEMNQHKEEVVEIIAPMFLRKALSLKDGDDITIELDDTNG